MPPGMDGNGSTTERDLRHQLETAQAIAHLGSWQWDVATGTVTWSDELYRIYGLSPHGRAITFEFFLSCVHPDERARIQGQIEAAIQNKGRFAYREIIQRPSGEPRTLDTVGEVRVDADGNVTGLIGTCRDITDEVRLHERERLIDGTQIIVDGERRALEMLAEGASLPRILDTMILAIEAASPGTIGSILLLDATGLRVRHGAAPNLPEAFTRAIDGSAIGPTSGSCGTAAYRREPVLVSDIDSDPLWADYRELARPHGLRACWSWPIVANDGRVLGTFALYHREVRLPDAAARASLERAAHVTRLVLERRALDEQLTALAARIEAVREDERTRIARDLHDQLGQGLTGIKLDIGWLARRIEDPTLRTKLDEMAASSDEIIQTVRRISADLRPGILDDVGLRAAIEWQAEEFAKRYGKRAKFRSNLGDLQLDRELATTMFRIFQESLTNVARHASATTIEIALIMEHGFIKLEIADDGVGIPEIGPRGATLGILGMGERARRLGGELTVKRRAPTGTVVTVSVPLRFASAAKG